MIEFLVAYWQYLLLGIAIIVEALFFFLKKRPSLNLVDRITSLIDDALPAVIRLAEASCTEGRAKMCFVVRVMLDKIRSYHKDADETYWSKVIIDKTEAILSCPQKKETL